MEPIRCRLDPADAAKTLQILRDSVDDLSHWGKHSIHGVEFYQLGGDSWGDDPYEGFSEHVVVSEIMAARGEI